MDDTLLYFRLRIYSLYGVCKACKAVHARNQDVVNAPVLKTVEYAEPELGALVLANPHTQHVADAVHLYANSYIHGLFDDLAFTADVEVYGVQKYYSVDAL